MKGFNDYEFMMYLERTFTGLDNYFLRETIGNIIEYAHNHEHVSKDQFVYFLTDMIPEVSFGEVAQFADDDILTEAGILKKREFAEAQQ